MQAEATASTPSNSQVRRAPPAGDDAGAGRFAEVLKAAHGREEVRASDLASNSPEAGGAEAGRGAAPPLVDQPPTQETAQPADATPAAEEGSAIPEAAGVTDALPGIPPLATAAPAATEPTLTVIGQPIQPSPSPAASTTSDSVMPTATPAASPTSTPSANTASANTTSANTAAVTTTPFGPPGPPAPQQRDAMKPAAGEAAPTTQAMAPPDALPKAAPGPSLVAPNGPPIAEAGSAPPAAEPAGVAAAPMASPPASPPASLPVSLATEAATSGTAPPGLLAAAAAPSTRPAKASSSTPTSPSVQPVSSIGEAQASPVFAVESSAPAPVTTILAPAGIAARTSDGSDPSIQAIGIAFGDAIASRATAPGPALPDIQDVAEIQAAPRIHEGTEGATVASPTPGTTSSSPAAQPLRPPLANATADRPVRPPRQTPAGQIVPVAIALSLGTEARGSITVSLDPIELGRVDVRVERMGDIATVQVIAERPETLQLLQRDQATLDRALADAGIGGGGRSLSFSLGGEGRGAQDRPRRPAAAMPGMTDSAAPIAEQRGAGRPRALLDIAV